MKLLIQPEDGVAPLVAAIKKAKKSVDIVIFRFDRAENRRGLKAAAERGVSVSALIAHANRGGEKSLRKLEMRARKELRIYDPNDCRRGDAARARRTGQQGSGHQSDRGRWPRSPDLRVRPLTGFRLHTRTIIRDRREAFVGSQSLRKAELDSRREVGVIVRESKVVSGLIDTFEADWGVKETRRDDPGRDTALKKTLKTMVEKLSPLSPLVKEAVQRRGLEEGKRQPE